MTNALCKTALTLALTSSMMLPANAGTTTADFLKWERKSQESFIQISITMAGVIAAQSKKNISICIDDWYFKDARTKEKRNQEILEFMPKLKQYSPTTVVLSILNDVCGKI